MVKKRNFWSKIEIFGQKSYFTTTNHLTANYFNPRLTLFDRAQSTIVRALSSFFQINIDEEPIRCAAREVFEEVGYDISNLIDKKDFIEIELTGQINRLYLCRGVPLSTKFETKTRNEIRGIKWFPVNNLPVRGSKSPF